MRAGVDVSPSQALVWLWSMHLRSGRWRIALAAACAVCVGFFEYLEALLLGRAVDLIGAGVLLPSLALLVGFWLAVAFLSLLASAVLGLLSDDVGFQVRSEIWQEFLRSAFAGPSSFFDRRHSGRLVRTAVSGTDAAFDIWSSVARAYLPAVLGLVVLLPLCAILNWVMALALFTVAGLSCALSFVALRLSYGAQAAVEQVQGEAAARAADLLAHASLVRAYGIANRETAEVRRRMEAARLSQMGVARLWTLVSGLSRLSAACGVVAMLLIGAVQHAEGAASVGDVVAFLGFAALAAARIEMLLHGLQQAAQRLPLIWELRAMLAASPPALLPDVGPVPDRRRGGSVSLALEGVRFSYLDGREVLGGLDLVVSPGEAVAVVGASGAGKSTLFALLLGLRRPSVGRILVDGEDLALLDVETWRKRVAVVFQDAHLLHRTVAENVDLGNSEPDLPQVEACLRTVGLEHVVGAMPGGAATVIDEGGTSLSGGERQRLAIARALMRDPCLVLLDEPTSALDAEGEAAVRAAIARVRSGRTLLLIAHRLSTLTLVDRIVVLDGGVIVEEGSLEALSAQGPRFKALFGLG